MKNCVILNAADLDDSVVENTTKKIIAHTEKFYLLSTSLNMRLHNVIDKLSKTLKDKAALTCVRFAYDIDFELVTEIRTGDGEESFQVHSLAELLDKLEYDENLMLKRDDYHITINDDDVDAEKADTAVKKLFQQMIFLNLNIDVRKKSVIEKSRKRPLKIAFVSGGIKSGKSILINSLLKRDYVPTSSNLPTPNVIKYVPAPADSELRLEYKEKTIVLKDEYIPQYVINLMKENVIPADQKYMPASSDEYRDKTITFKNAEDLSSFIGEVWQKVWMPYMLDEYIPTNMTIYYPCDELNRYEIWDIPGKHFSGMGDKYNEDCQKIAEKIIKAADVCIFVMNYSNHLTDYEVKFLNQIYDTLDNNNKLDSFVIAVNGIDERYAAEVEKSVSRTLDYIQWRLEEFNYKNIPIFGTSALQSFYLDIVLKLIKESELEIDEDDTFYYVIRRLRKKHREYMGPARFIEDSLKNLEDFHAIDDPDAKTLENFSGIPQLWRYVNYIGEQKINA